LKDTKPSDCGRWNSRRWKPNCIPC